MSIPTITMKTDVDGKPFPPPKERPILFSAPMVRALLNGTKTQTRRIAKWKPREPGINLAFSGLDVGFYHSDLMRSGWVLRSRDGRGCWNDRTYPLHCPYGLPGSRLWCRETWGLFDTQPSDGPERATVFYRATDETRRELRNQLWRPSIFMPRWASRVALEVTAVRIERLKSITDTDARAEGMDWAAPQFYGKAPPDDDREDPRQVGYPPAGASFARDNYRRLWTQLNGAASWDANPHVWVITFKRVEHDGTAVHPLPDGFTDEEQPQP